MLILERSRFPYDCEPTKALPNHLVNTQIPSAVLWPISNTKPQLIQATQSNANESCFEYSVVLERVHLRICGWTNKMNGCLKLENQASRACDRDWVLTIAQIFARAATWDNRGFLNPPSWFEDLRMLSGWDPEKQQDAKSAKFEYAGDMQTLLIVAVAVTASLSGAAVAATGFVQGPPWAHFSRQRYLAHTQDMVDIGSGRRSGTSGFRYTMSLTRTKLGGKQVILWADSATCAAMTPIIASMSKIAMPRPALYGVPGESKDIVVDGSGYELSTPSIDIMGNVTISSSEGSPLSQWIDNALQRLDSCWTPSSPT